MNAITLRKLEPDDLPLLYRWENDMSVWIDTDNHNPLSKQDLRAYILATTGEVYKDGELRLIICVHEEVGASVEVGVIDLYDLDIRNGKAGVAIYIAPEHRGKGYAKGAIKQMVFYACSVLGLTMLYALIRPSNKASEGAFASAGFRHVTTLPCWVREGDVAVWQVLEKE